jgi:hypothetical protein
MLVQLGSNPVNTEGETSVCSLNRAQGIHTTTKHSIMTLFTSLIFNKFSDLFGIVYVAVVKNEDTARARIWVCQRDLLKEILSIVHRTGVRTIPHGHGEIGENTLMLLILGLCRR